MAGARWLRQRSNARKCEFAMKALTVWRAVPPCCHAVLAQSMRAQHASNTTARANYHTHPPSFKRPAITFGRTSGWRRRRWNQSSEGRVGRVFKLGERSPLMCPPWATTPSAAINQAWQHAKRRWQHAIGDHEITPSSEKPHEKWPSFLPPSGLVLHLFTYHFFSVTALVMTSSQPR